MPGSPHSKPRLSIDLSLSALQEMAEQPQAQAEESKLSTTMAQKLRALDPPDPSQFEEARGCTIPRVPSLRRESYEPKMFPIGPYHRDDDNPSSSLFYPTRPYKWRFLRDLLNRTPRTCATLSTYIREIKLLELEIRSCYSELVSLPSDEFVELMVLDGCFLIEFLIKWSYAEPDPLFVPGWVFPVIRTDILKLENQIPFFVLRRLFLVSELAPLSLTVLLAKYLGYGDSASVLPRIPIRGTIHHLLHLYHLCEIPLVSRWEGGRSGQWRLDQRSPRKLPSATELKDAGITFRRKKTDGKYNFLDVTFQKGTMLIPRISIEHATKCRFENLVAFEQCCPDVGNNLASYLLLMNCLVSGVDDARLLRRCGVLESKLGRDELVVDFFSDAWDCAFLDHDDHYLVDLFRDVAEYCELDRHKWRAIIMRDYFSNPWSVMSLLAAVLLLLLAIAQTYFAAFSYFRPPSGSF